MRRKFLLSALWIAGAYATTASAHHSFDAEFDASAPVTLDGVVTKVELVNPHAWIHLKVEGPGKKTTLWKVEAGTPNTLFRAGIDKNTVKIGTKISVRGFQAKDRSCSPACLANGRNMILPDGKKLFIGSEGTGAPPK